MRDPSRIVPAGVFLILLAASAYTWQARDWNASSRLMLTYSLVDRGQLSINGLEDHTRDRAKIGRDLYYSDKLPGFSLFAIPPYLFARHVLSVPPHPLNRPGPGFTHWPADYWIAVGTSGVATALTGAMLAAYALRVGCGPRRAVLVGLAYGLATPAAVYATLNYGHQLTAAFLLGSFLLFQAGRASWRVVVAGWLAASAVVVELQVAPVAAVLGAYCLGLVLMRRLPPTAPISFALGAVGPLFILAIYNTLAFGSPLDMGYFHEDLRQFRDVHNAANPLGLRGPDLTKLVPLLWGEHRGLLFYAPILVLAPFGWAVMARRRMVAGLAVSLAVCVSMLLVNLSYPEWTGGWSTGPRLLLPLIPFAMLPVAVLLAVGRRWPTAIATALTAWGAVLMLLFLGVGGRVPQDIERPLRDFVLPVWRGDPRVFVRGAEPFARNLFALSPPGEMALTILRPQWAWLQWMPFVAFSVGATIVLLIVARPPTPTIRPPS